MIVLFTLVITVIILMSRGECHIRREALQRFVPIVCNEVLLTIFLLFLNAKLADRRNLGNMVLSDSVYCGGSMDY